MKILFIGNSATYVNDIPKMLERLANAAGYPLETDMVVKGGFRLSQHANGVCAREKIALDEIEKGYDIVFLQEVGNCFATEENRQETALASEKLFDAIQKTGAKACYYVRPPYGRDLEGFAAAEQCRLLDDLFVGLSQRLGVECVFANRAFADAIPKFGRRLWGNDNAHTSVLGAYLIVCSLFAALFGVSSKALETVEEITPEEALLLQEIADRISLEGYIPWKA